MARSTKIACEGAIYTVHRDAYGIVTETDADVSAEAPPGADDPMSEERERYAHVIQELTEFEEAIAQAEALNLLAEDADDPHAEHSEAQDLLL